MNYIYTEKAEQAIKEAANELGWHPRYVVEIVGHPTEETSHYTSEDYISESNKYFEQVGYRLLEPIAIDDEGFRYSVHDTMEQKASEWTLFDR